MVLVALSAGFSQTADAPPASKKPLRERLLERALQGDADAQFDLAKNYETGRIGLPKDFAQAEHWYREAAAQGEPFAQASLGIMFNFGKGVRQDYVQAYMWYEIAISHSTEGDRDTIVEMRDNIAQQMSAEQIAEGRRLARQWKPAVKQ
jgi:TPR repeat protein